MPSNDEIRQILSGPGTSHWLKDALTLAHYRDPVDTVNDAELLAMVLGHRADQINTTAWAALDARNVIKRAQNNGGLPPGQKTGDTDDLPRQSLAGLFSFSRHCHGLRAVV
jgi:hypothetical protein